MDEARKAEQFRRVVKELEKLVDVVATLGELAATVTAPRRSVWPLLYPESLHAELKEFTWSLRDTLDHGDATSLSQRGVTSLSQALATLRATLSATFMATLRATPGPLPADVRATVRAWREAWGALDERWTQLYRDAVEMYDTFKGEATTETTNKATSLAGGLRDETLRGRGTAGDSLVATAPQPSVSLSSAVATPNAPMATGQAGAATRRGQRVEEALELLGRLIDACDLACHWFPFELHIWLRRMETAQEGKYKVFDDYGEYSLIKVAEFEWLWEASARLTTDHLLVTLGEIDFLLSSPYGGSGGPGGPRGREVAERCQKAIEDIPRLLKECDIAKLISSL